MPNDSGAAHAALEKALHQASREVPQCIAAGYVDMTTATLVALRSQEPLPASIVNLLAAVTSDLFQGRNVSQIEKLFRESRHQAEDGTHYFREIMIYSAKRLHVFLRGKRSANHVVVFVCRSTENVGMVLSQARAAMPAIEDAL